MVERTRSLWKRQNVLNRGRSTLPAYDVMQEEQSDDEDAAQAMGRAPHHQISKLIVHAPSDPAIALALMPSSAAAASLQHYQHQLLAGIGERAPGVSLQVKKVQRGMGGQAQLALQFQRAVGRLLSMSCTQPSPGPPQSYPLNPRRQSSNMRKLISWDEPGCAQDILAPAVSNSNKCHQATPVQQQQQHTSQPEQRTDQTQQQLSALQLSSGLQGPDMNESHLAASQPAYSNSSSELGSYEAALALVPKRDLFATIIAAPGLSQRLPVFTLGRAPLVSDQTFEQSAVW